MAEIHIHGARGIGGPSVTVVVLLPLSLASLGELPVASLLGVGLMTAITLYVVCSALAKNLDDSSMNDDAVDGPQLRLHQHEGLLRLERTVASNSDQPSSERCVGHMSIST